MVSFKIRAEGSMRVGDPVEIRRALSLLIAPGDRHELRALPGAACRPAPGDDLDAAVNAAMDLSDRQVYYSLNPIRPDADRASKKTVTRRRWFLVDIDTVRPVDVSSTDAEKAAAYSVAGSIALHLIDRGWPAPLIVDSGNGWHLLYRVDLPNDPMSQQILKVCLASLGKEFDTSDAKVDRATHDAPRISKLPGTYAMKGPDTLDRPHRLARIVMEPDRLDVVTLEQLKALADPPKQAAAASSSGPSFATTAGNGTGKAAYVRAAIERECYRVMIAPHGERNHALNRAAFALGQFDGWPEMNAGEARESLRQAAIRAGLTEHETRLTIESGWTAGVKEPRPRPVDPAANGQAGHQAAIDLTKRIIILGSEVTPRKVEWLWTDRVPIGKLTTFAGWGGLGKSFVTMDLAARISRGGEIPGGNGQRFTAASVLILNTEDDPDDTSVPRLIEAGADLKRVAFARPEVLGQFTLGDLKTLDVMLGQLGGVKLVVIDPATAHLGDINDHKNSELRGLLMPLSLWAMDRRVAVILVTHVNKAQAGNVEAMSRVVGSVAWVNAVRAAVMFARDPDDKAKRLFVPFKANNAPERLGLQYRIVPTDSLARVEWMGEVDTSADEAMAGTKKARARNAAEWLTERFRERRSWPSDELYDLARAEGISRSALWEAGGPDGALPLRREQIAPADGGRRYWQWMARPGWPPDENSKSCETLKRCPDNPREYKDLRSVSGAETERNAERNSRVSEFQSFTVSEESSGETLPSDQVIDRIFKPF